MSTKQFLQEFVTNAIERLPAHLRAGSTAILIFSKLGFVSSPEGREKIVLGLRRNDELPESTSGDRRLSKEHLLEYFFGDCPLEGKLNGRQCYQLRFGATDEDNVDIYLQPIIQIGDVVHWGEVAAQKNTRKVCEYFCNRSGATSLSYHVRMIKSSDHVAALLSAMQEFVDAKNVDDLLSLMGSDRQNTSNDSPIGLTVAVSTSTYTTDTNASERAPEPAAAPDSEKLSASELASMNRSAPDDDEDFNIEGINDFMRRPPMPTEFPNRSQLVAALKRVTSEIEIATRATTFVDQALYFILGPQTENMYVAEKITEFQQNPKCTTPVKKGLRKVIGWRNILDHNSVEQLPGGLRSQNMSKNGFLFVFDMLASALQHVYDEKVETQSYQDIIAGLESDNESLQDELDSRRGTPRQRDRVDQLRSPRNQNRAPLDQPSPHQWRGGPQNFADRNRLPASQPFNRTPQHNQWHQRLNQPHARGRRGRHLDLSSYGPQPGLSSSGPQPPQRNNPLTPSRHDSSESRSTSPGTSSTPRHKRQQPSEGDEQYNNKRPRN